MDIIGRNKEKSLLQQLLTSNVAEFLTIYGRRRIGKTFLIRNFFNKKNIVFFNVTGAKDAPMREQITHFMTQIGNIFFNGFEIKSEKNWDHAFKKLTEAMGSVQKNKKIILFFDEFPWMATKNSRLIQTIDYYWNQYWSNDNRIKLIICGSSASWIIDKIIYNKGGLHNRSTKSILLEPYSLVETKKYLNSIGLKLTNRQITQLYMVTGGVPHYLSMCNKKLSVAQNIDQLSFTKKSFLSMEFDKLFSSLFEGYEEYIAIVRLIASTRYGIAQEEILNKITSKGKGGLAKLKSLEECGFIIGFKPYGKQTRDTFYKIIDEYLLFYFHWIEPVKTVLLHKSLGKNYWEKKQMSPSWRSWSGYAFEAICHKHSIQISDALNIGATSIPYTWRFIPPNATAEKGVQIDLLYDQDDAITLCEIKYSQTPFILNKEYAAKLLLKSKVFIKKTKTQKQILTVLIASNGIKPTMYSEELISSVITLEDLFKPAD